MSQLMKSPFPYFGGKSKVIHPVWERFGDDCTNYVEPFFGSGAMLRGRPQPFDGVETVNDACGFIANFWRAVKSAPDEVAEHADWPVNENDLHARHYWLVERKDTLQAKLEGSPEFYDAKVAGWWVWGLACWIGSGFCSGRGPWGVAEVNGHRKLVHLGNAGQGVNRKRVHLGNAGQGVNRKRVELAGFFAELSERFEHVRVCCGDWARVTGPTVTQKHGLCAVFLDPPYAHAVRHDELYRVEDDCAAAVRKWCAENGDNPILRIALCGYAGEGHEDLEAEGWSAWEWKAAGGYGSQGQGEGRDNAKLERIWFSPHCVPVEEDAGLFAGVA